MKLHELEALIAMQHDDLTDLLDEMPHQDLIDIIKVAIKGMKDTVALDTLLKMFIILRDGNVHVSWINGSKVDDTNPLLANYIADRVMLGNQHVTNKVKK